MISFKKLFPILSVLFLGYLGFSLSLPLFPPMFLGKGRIFLQDAPLALRSTILGCILAVYPLGQFVGAPILGRLSDKYGRRRILLVSLFLIILAFISVAVSIHYHSIIFLALTRFINGVLEGNIVIAQASITDLATNEKEKQHGFSMVTTATSLAFVFGPLIGGTMAELFNFESAFWTVSVLSSFTFFFIYSSFVETAKPDPTIRVHMLQSLGLFLEMIRKKTLSSYYFANFLSIIPCFFFFNFFAVYLLKYFHFSVQYLAYATAYLSLPICFAPYFIKKMKYTSFMGTMIFNFLLAFFMIVIVLPNTPWALFFTLIPVGVFISCIITYTPILISNAAHNSYQGQALGANQSIMVLAETLTALIGGPLIAIFPSLPLVVAAFIALLAGAFLYFWPLFKEERKKKHHHET